MLHAAQRISSLSTLLGPPPQTRGKSARIRKAFDRACGVNGSSVPSRDGMAASAWLVPASVVPPLLKGIRSAFTLGVRLRGVDRRTHFVPSCRGPWARGSGRPQGISRPTFTLRVAGLTLMGGLQATTSLSPRAAGHRGPPGRPVSYERYLT